MRYTYEYKRKCVELYREGKWPETPEGVSDKSFRDKVRLWVRAEDSRGPEVLKHKNFNRNWTPEERLELVSQVMSGKSCVSVAIEAGIQDRLLYQWVQNYKTKGYNGLVEMKKGRPSKGVPQMKKEEARPLNESVPFPVSWTVKMKKKQKETQDILSYHSQAAGCSDKARAKASGGRQPIEECGRTGL